MTNNVSYEIVPNVKTILMFKLKNKITHKYIISTVITLIIIFGFVSIIHFLNSNNLLKVIAATSDNPQKQRDIVFRKDVDEFVFNYRFSTTKPLKVSELIKGMVGDQNARIEIATLGKTGWIYYLYPDGLSNTDFTLETGRAYVAIFYGLSSLNYHYPIKGTKPSIITLPLINGDNLIGFPNASTSARAQNILIGLYNSGFSAPLQIEHVYDMANYDLSNPQTYQLYTLNSDLTFSGDNFLIDPLQGYFLAVNESKNWTEVTNESTLNASSSANTKSQIKLLPAPPLRSALKIK